MSVKIRLKRMGSKKRPFYRIVATNSRNPRDGRFIETLGHYDPLTDPPTVRVDEERIFEWMERGAIPTPNTESLLRRIGFMQKWQLLKQGVDREELEEKLEAMGKAGAAGKVAGKAEKGEGRMQDSGVGEGGSNQDSENEEKEGGV